jgi:3-phenylpropionate/trans-cinnamate dioxygenase ferredoxin subunit
VKQVVSTVRHAVGHLEDFEPGKIGVVEVANRSIGIVNTGDALYAVLNVCPHELAPVCAGSVAGTMLPSQPGAVEYGLEGRILRCPWHGYEYDLGNGGKTVFTTFKARVRLFPVSVEDGQVMVEIKEHGGPEPAED